MFARSTTRRSSFAGRRRCVRGGKVSPGIRFGTPCIRRRAVAESAVAAGDREVVVLWRQRVREDGERLDGRVLRLYEVRGMCARAQMFSVDAAALLEFPEAAA